VKDPFYKEGSPPRFRQLEIAIKLGRENKSGRETRFNDRETKHEALEQGGGGGSVPQEVKVQGGGPVTREQRRNGVRLRT